MNRRRIYIAKTLVLPAMVLALAGCTAQQDLPLPNEVTTALERAFNKGDIEGCVDIFADDAEIISEDAPAVRGRDAIDRFFKDQVAREISFDTDSSMSVVSGDVAVEQGTYRVRNVIQGVDVEYGDYLNVWRREKNGRWKALRSMYNVTMSPSSVVSVFEEEDDRPM